MKPLVLVVALACPFIAFSPAQDNRNTDSRLHVLSAGPAGNATLAADSIERDPSYPSVVRLKGAVEIKSKTVAQASPLNLMIMEIHADEADYHEDSGEIEARGKVRVDYRDDPTNSQSRGNLRVKLEAVR